MKIFKKFLKYCFMISINVIILFGLKIMLPTDSSNSNNSVQNNMVYTNKI